MSGKVHSRVVLKSYVHGAIWFNRWVLDLATWTKQGQAKFSCFGYSNCTRFGRKLQRTKSVQNYSRRVPEFFQKFWTHFGHFRFGHFLEYSNMVPKCWNSVVKDKRVILSRMQTEDGGPGWPIWPVGAQKWPISKTIQTRQEKIRTGVQRFHGWSAIEFGLKSRSRVANLASRGPKVPNF